MSEQLDRFSRTCRAVFCDPKLKAYLDWSKEYGISFQLEQQWPREEMETFVAGGGHPNPDRRIRLVVHEMPDFDWWEPRYDQPYRRQQARYREFGL